MKDLNNTFFYLSLIGLLSSFGCGDAVGDRSAPHTELSETRRFHDKRHAFSFTIPRGYHCGAKPPDHDMIFLGPAEKNFTVNFVVDVKKDDGTPLEASADRLKKTMVWVLPEYRPIEEGATEIDGKKCCWVSATFRWKEKKVRNLQYLIRGDNAKVYIFTFAAPVGSFARHRPVFEQCAETLRIE